jgi:hypothetical protein
METAGTVRELGLPQPLPCGSAALGAGNRAVSVWAVRVGLGLLLLCAAALKTHALLVETRALRGLPISPGPGGLLIAAELSLGLWLLSGSARRGSWWAAVVGFAGLCLVSHWPRR